MEACQMEWNTQKVSRDLGIVKCLDNRETPIAYPFIDHC